MNKFMKQIAVAALAVTTINAGMATQAHADASFNRAIVGLAVVGIVINQVRKNKARNYRAAPRQQAGSYNRNRVQSNSYANRRYNDQHNSRSRYGGSQNSLNY